MLTWGEGKLRGCFLSNLAVGKCNTLDKPLEENKGGEEMARKSRDDFHDQVIIVTRNDNDPTDESVWDGVTRIYNPATMDIEAWTGEISGTITTNPATVKTTLVDSPSSTVTYVGKADIGSSTASAVWQIKKISVSGTQTITQYANSAATYINIWDNRASLTYG